MNCLFRQTNLLRWTHSLIALAALLAVPAHAQLSQGQTQDVGELEQMLVKTLGAEIGAPGGPAAPIDRRMRLAPCPGHIQIDPPTMGAVAIRCTSLGWRIRVPMLGSSADRFTPRKKTQAMVRRGDSLELIADGTAFRVSTSATALEDGDIGDRVRVTTSGKSSNLFVEVMGVGQVRLAGFK